jgi:hypothetical protein
MIIYSDPPREKKQAVQVSDYEQAVERLKKVKNPDGSTVPWATCAVGLSTGELTYWATIKPHANPLMCGGYEAKAANPLDAACAAIDQFNNALLAGEEKPEVHAGIDLGARDGSAMVVAKKRGDGWIPVWFDCTGRFITPKLLPERQGISEEEYRRARLCEPGPVCAVCRLQIKDRRDAFRLLGRRDGPVDVCAQCFNSTNNPAVDRLIEGSTSFQAGI